jgi:hypothetical protein
MAKEGGHVSLSNLRSKERREPTAPPTWPRTRTDERGVLHIELANTTTALSISTQTIPNGVRLVYDSVGRLIEIEVAPRE